MSSLSGVKDEQLAVHISFNPFIQSVSQPASQSINEHFEHLQRARHGARYWSQEGEGTGKPALTALVPVARMEVKPGSSEHEGSERDVLPSRVRAHLRWGGGQGRPQGMTLGCDLQKSVRGDWQVVAGGQSEHTCSEVGKGLGCTRGPQRGWGCSGGARRSVGDEALGPGSPSCDHPTAPSSQAGMMGSRRTRRGGGQSTAAL